MPFTPSDVARLAELSEKVKTSGDADPEDVLWLIQTMTRLVAENQALSRQYALSRGLLKELL